MQYLVGVEILKGLLFGGAHVVITTSRYQWSTVEVMRHVSLCSLSGSYASGIATNGHVGLSSLSQGAKWAGQKKPYGTMFLCSHVSRSSRSFFYPTFTISSHIFEQTGSLRSMPCINVD
jgi:hypothetical protein